MTEPEKVTGVVEAILRAAEAVQVPDEDLRAYEARLARDRRRELLRSSGVRDVLSADAMQRLIDDTTQDTAAMRLVQRWIAAAATARTHRLAPQVRVLVLLGERGVGKTVAAAWALAREGGRYAACTDLVGAYATPFAPDRAPYLRARGVGLLVVDEVPRVATKECRAMLHDLIDRRQRGQLTLVLGNGSPAEWDALLDPRTQDRLAPMTFVRVIRGDSQRRPIADPARPIQHAKTA